MDNRFSLNKQKGGYTIIETMISITLFLVVVISGMSALMNAGVVHQKSQDMRSILDNLSFVMEDMSRNLRTGYRIRCLFGNDPLTDVTTPRSCSNGWGIAFEVADGIPNDPTDQWAYYLDANGKIYKSTAGAVAGSFIPITPDEAFISGVSGFSVLGAEASPSNLQQPFVTIRLYGTITSRNNVVTPFSLQTSASQRLVDI